jgi:predicted phage tail protein
MSWQTPLIQIIALIGAMLIASFLPIPYLAVVLATVRLLLVMTLGVALIYLGVLIQRQAMQPVPISRDDDKLSGVERGR